jgi:hypothetical protein
MSIRATSPFPVYLDNDGKPLTGGYVYFGTSGANPETTPQTVYWDEALTIPAAQPLRTLNGFFVRNGTPANVYLAAVYSITVRNKNRVLLYSSLVNVGLPSSTAMIPVVSASTLAVARDALGVSKKVKGYQAISLTHFTDTLEPSVTAGSEIEVDGTFYEFPIDEAATAGTWAAIAISTEVYMYLVPAGAAHTWIYSATAPTWGIAKQGWYNGANRCFGMLYKDAASLYQFKNLIPAIEAPLTFIAQVSSTVNPFIFNLPASDGSGKRVRVIDYATAATNLVRIHPAGADSIGSAGNVDCYLQNIDQSGVVYKHQFLDLVDSAAGTWTVVGGQFCPHQTVDTDGQQYHLGKLHKLPLGNTTNRSLYSDVPAAQNFWSAAISGSGLVGVPAGAKGIRVEVTLQPYATVADNTNLFCGFSDNGTNVPTGATAHPCAQAIGYSSAIGLRVLSRIEIDIPLNSSGQFYIYTILATNVTIASSSISVIALGYYTGD